MKPNLASPTNKTTLIWGDGNDAHGIPPGMTHNPLGLPAGTIITLTNSVVTQPRNPAVLAYDGRDHIGATRPIVVTRAHWPTTTGTVIAGAVSVLSTAQWGTNYLCPVGQNMTNGLMQLCGDVCAGRQTTTTVTIDPTGTNGAGVTNIVLNQGESYLYNGGIIKGGKASAFRRCRWIWSSATRMPRMRWIGSILSGFFVGATRITRRWGRRSTGSRLMFISITPIRPTSPSTVTTKRGSEHGDRAGHQWLYQYTMPSSSGASFIGTNSAIFTPSARSTPRPRRIRPGTGVSRWCPRGC